MFCPGCSSLKSRVVDKRGTEASRAIRRRRECLKCGNRFTTYERIKPIIMVLKSNKKKEPYDREKIMIGMKKALEGRPVTKKKFESVIDEIDSEIKGMNCTQIKSSLIGDIVIKKLKKLDKVAFVRFMSFYKKYNDIKTFKKELGS